MQRMKVIGQAAYHAGDLFYECGIRTVKCGKSVADPSYFRPNSSIVHNAKGLPPPSENQYTFANGKDDGREMPPYARKDADIVEITQFAKRQSEIVKENVEKARVRAETREIIRQSQNALKESSVNANPSPTV